MDDTAAQVKKLKNGVGVQSLLDEAYQILGNPIAMFNTEYDLMAYTECATDDPIWVELVTKGTLSIQTQKLFDREGFIEELANCPKIAFMKSDKLKYDRICGKVFNKNNTYVANLIIVACNRSFEENDPIVFEEICELISREIRRSDAYQEYEQTRQESIIRSLIDGTYDVKLDMAQVGILYDSLESGLYIAVADISLGSPECTIVDYRNVLSKIEPAYKYAIYSNYVVFIVSTNDDILDVPKALGGFMEVLDANNIYVGISSRFENLFALGNYYLEAQKAMTCALESKSDQRIFPYDIEALSVMEQIKALENGGGIQYFSNIALTILGNPVLFHDMELKLLSCTEGVEVNDPIWEELITYGISSGETIEMLKAEGIISSVEGTKAGALLTCDKLRYDRISWKIYNSDNIMVGCLCLVASIKPFERDVLALFGAFCKKFSKEVSAIEFYHNYGQVYSGTIINRLIRSKIDDYIFFSEDIGNIYDGLMENLYLVVVDTAQCRPEHRSLSLIRELFNQSRTVNRYAVYDKYIVVICSLDNTSLEEEGDIQKIGKLFGAYNIHAGISHCFSNIYELQKYYTEAVHALNEGVKSKDRQKE